MKNFVLKMFLLLTMLVGVSTQAMSDPTLAISTNIPTGVDLYCSGKYYGVVTLDDGMEIIYHGSFTLSVNGDNVTMTISDFPNAITYDNHNWKMGLLDKLRELFPTAKKFYAELTSNYKDESKK